MARMAKVGAATVGKALDVLFHLHEAEGPLGLSEIGRALGVPKSSCHRLLASLVNRDIVERDEAGRYRPGLALLSLGFGVQNRDPVVSAARSALVEEAHALGETVFVVGLRHGRLRVLDKIEGRGFLRAAPAVGDLIPSDVTAAGKLYQVYGEDAEVRAAFDQSPRTVLEATEAAELQRRGYAVNRDAWIDGLSVLGVPIWQRAGPGQRRMVATLALASASARFEALGEGLIAGRLLAAAEGIAERLGLRRPESQGFGASPTSDHQGGEG
ncbi:MAG: IclR family transcriptional regulator [Myxococcota bacterium]